jgi:hypothetical protein
MLTYGVRIGYTGTPKVVLSSNLTTANENPSTITAQLHKDLALGRVSPHNGSFPFFCSPLGLVGKSDGGWRRIHHLSHPHGDSVNDWIPEPYGNMEYTNMEHIFTLVRQAGKGALLIKKDLKEAFRMIPVAPADRWLLGFLWQGLYYHENCLPFGLRTAPFLFNLVAEAFHWILTTHLGWHLLAHYLDDFIHIVPSTLQPEATLTRINDEYNRLTTKLGLLRNTSKDASGTRVEVLGIEINSIEMTAQLSLRKLEKAIRLVTYALTARRLTLLQTQQLAGYLSFCSSVVRIGRTYLRRLWDFMATFAKPWSLRPLTATATADLIWWRDLLPRFNGIRILQDANRAVHHLYTDASNHGMGAFLYKDNTADGDWHKHASTVPPTQMFSYDYEQHEAALHINTTEVLVIKHAFDLWAQRWRHGSVVIHTDNTTAEAGFCTGTTKGNGMELLRSSLLQAASYDVVLHAVRITTSDNTLADALSRLDWTTVANYAPQWGITSPSTRPRASSTDSGP